MPVFEKKICARADLASAAPEQTRQVGPREELEEEDGDRADARDSAAGGRHAAAATARRAAADPGVVVERHALTVPPAPFPGEEP